MRASMAMTPPCRPVRAPSRRYEKKRAGSHDVQAPAEVMAGSGMPARLELDPGGQRQVDGVAVDRLGAESGAERAAELGVDRVAAGSDARPDGRGGRSRVAERGHRVREHAGHQPPPARVRRRDARSIGAPQEHRQAVGAEDHERDPGSIRHQGVALGPARQRPREAPGPGAARAIVRTPAPWT